MESLIPAKRTLFVISFKSSVAVHMGKVPRVSLSRILLVQRNLCSPSSLITELLLGCGSLAQAGCSQLPLQLDFRQRNVLKLCV